MVGLDTSEHSARSSLHQMPLAVQNAVDPICIRMRSSVCKVETPSTFSQQQRGLDVEVPSLERCMETFDRLDFNSTGRLSLSELRQAVAEIWLKFDEKSAIMRAYKTFDLNGDGFIGRNEFELFLILVAFYSNLWRDFDSADINHDQRLSKEEFVAAASRLRISNADETFGDMDANGDGYVLFDEFCSWMEQHKLRKDISDRGNLIIANVASSQVFDTVRGKEQTYVSRIFLKLRFSIDMLDATASDEEVESWAILIHNCMSQGTRAYHNLQRILDTSNLADPIQIIAILMTDTVCFVYDGGLSPNVKQILKGLMDEKDAFVISQVFSPKDDPYVAMVITIFGVSPGEWLDFYVLDKFLSAVVAARLLRSSMSMTLLVEIIACIEAAVPAEKDGSHSDAVWVAHEPRKPPVVHPAQGSREAKVKEQQKALEFRASLEPLYARLVETNEDFQLGLSKSKMVKIVQGAADKVNRSRGSIVTQDVVSHVGQVWSLLPEFNPALCYPKLYTVYDYHLAVKNLETLIYLNDNFDLMLSFRGVPDAKELASLKRKQQYNMEIGKMYIHCQAVSISVFAAIVELTGGDAPMCFVVGDPDSTQGLSNHMGGSLPELDPNELAASCNKVVYELLTHRKHTESSFDISNWAITAFIYGVVGDEGILKALQYTAHPMGKDRAKALLSSLPLELIIIIGEEIAKIAVSRTELIEELLNELEDMQLQALS